MRRKGFPKSSAAALAAAMIGLAMATPAAAQQQAGSAEADAHYRELSRQIEQQAGDPAFDYAFAVAALDAGHYGEAIVALQRVLAVQPDNAPARAELARAYALSGDADTARQEFATVVDDPTLPDPVRQRFTGLISQLDRQIDGGGRDISGFVEAGAGYDSNINAATDLTQITIPLFAFLGPGRLGAGARAQDDGFYEINGGVSAVAAINRQDRVFASALLNWRDNFDSDPFDIASLTGTAGYAHSFGNSDVASISAQVQKFWLGGDGYRTAIGAIGQYTHLLDGGDAIAASVQWTRLEYDTDPLRDADRYAFGVGYVTRLASLNATLGHEETRDPLGDAQSNTFFQIGAGAEVPVARRIAIVAGAGFDLRRYDARDILFMVEREDERLDASLGLKVAITDNLLFQPRATVTRNWSNIALYDYERWSASAALRFEF
ncbi:MAG: tetratricopeptide repeat protein [Erythrobacter sp.]|nr:tetratricopeptide repeat protein [Erythrobacter sp.]NCQ64453.1 tetratricopeptide repeat protein [Alphaproteobacteria bacterium]